MKRRNGEVFQHIFRGDFKKLKQSIENPNVRNDQGWTPLMMALCRKKSDIAMFLLKQSDVDVNATAPQSGDTALHIALRKNAESAVIARLIAKGARIDLENKGGESPLMIAIKNNILFQCRFPRFKDLQLIVSQGKLKNLQQIVEFDPNQREEITQQTALMFGYTKSIVIRQSIIDLFLEQGYDLEATDKNGWSLLAYEIKIGDFKMVEHLLKKGAVVSDYMYQIVKTKDIELLLQNFNATDTLVNPRVPKTIEQFSSVLDDDLQVYDPLMCCRMDFIDIDLDENIVFVVFDQNEIIKRAFCYDLLVLEKIFTRKRFLFECSKPVEGTAPLLEQVKKPYIAYVELQEEVRYAIEAGALKKVMQDKVQIVALFPQKDQLKCVSALKCIQIQYGRDYKGKKINVVSRLHGRLEDVMNGYNLKVIK